MDWLNYHHLLYFYMTAKEGSVTEASHRLNLAQPTVTAQIRSLEKAVGQKLFNRVGRNLVLTETGRMVYRYADEIFTLGRELHDLLQDRPVGLPLRFTVGVVDVIPKLVAHHLIEPALQLQDPLRIVCHEGKFDQLLSELSQHNLDLVISDAPIGPQYNIRAYNHLLGECGLSLLATTKPAGQYRKNFPHSLDGAPFLMPTSQTSLRRTLDQFFDGENIRPLIVAEFDDTALLKVFGQRGLGLFAVPSVIEKEVCRQYGVKLIGRLDKARLEFYAVSVERRLKHPAVVAISQSAQQRFTEWP